MNFSLIDIDLAPPTTAFLSVFNSIHWVPVGPAGAQHEEIHRRCETAAKALKHRGALEREKKL